MLILRNVVLTAVFLMGVGCVAAPGDRVAEDDSPETGTSEEEVTSGKITTARPEIGLVHVDGIRGILGDMGWGTGTVVLHPNAIVTSQQVTGGKSLAPRRGGLGTFTVTSLRGRTVHRVVEAAVIDDSKLALLRIDPPVDASITPAEIADPIWVDRARRDRAAETTFFGYGYRNLVCVPITGSDGQKSYVTRRYRDFGGLFTGPLGVGYTCEGDIGGPIVLGRTSDRGAVLSVNVNTVIDGFAEPGRYRRAIERMAEAWQ